MDLAKAMEGASEAGAGAEGPPGVGDVERSTVVEGTGEALLGPDPAGVGSELAYNR